MKDYFDWDVINREFPEEQRERLAKSGEAMPDGSYPIVTREDLENAIQAIGRAKDPDATKRHIRKRANALGAEELIPDEWVENWTPKRPNARASKDWYRIENKVDTGLTDVFIYDEVGGFGVSASDFTAEIRGIQGDLSLHLNSPGGDVFDGFAIFQALKARTGKTTVVVDGLAASIASVIAMGADEVVMAPKATLMIHDGWTMSVGNAADMRKTADLLDKTSDNIASVYADKAGGTVEFWRERMREETWYSADEALAAGLIDQVQGKTAKREDFDLSMFNHAGRDTAPAPILTPSAKIEETPAPVAEDKETEPAPFVWDFAAFRDALQEGVN